MKNRRVKKESFIIMILEIEKAQYKVEKDRCWYYKQMILMTIVQQL